MPSRRTLVELYWIHNVAFGDIAAAHNMTPGELEARFRRLGILKRRGTPKEARVMMLWPSPVEYERQRLKALAGSSGR